MAVLLSNHWKRGEGTAFMFFKRHWEIRVDPCLSAVKKSNHWNDPPARHSLGGGWVFIRG